jgi:hypothetical protein
LSLENFNEVAQTGARPSHAEMKLSQRSGIPVMFDEDRQPRKCGFEAILQSDFVPTGQMRRIQQNAFADFQRASDRDAERGNLAARGTGTFQP